MVVAIEEWMLIAGIGIPLLISIVCLSFVFSIKNSCPDLWTHFKAQRSGENICRVHFKGRGVRDYIASIDKDEKGMGTNYWKVPEVGLKFKPGNEDVEFIEGSIPCVNYFENMTAAIKVQEAVAYSQLKDYFRSVLKMPIDGIEQAALYVLQESEKVTKDRAIKNSKINSLEAKKYLKNFLDIVERRKAELKAIRQESGVFTFQTAMKALDNMEVFNSSYFAHAKEVIIAAALRKEENKFKDLMQWAIIGFILALGAATIIIVSGK